MGRRRQRKTRPGGPARERRPGEGVEPATRGGLARLRENLFRPIDAASVVFFRVAFGLLMAWDLLGYLTTGRLERLYVTPILHFKYYGFEWVEPLSESGLELLFAALIALALAIAAGLFYRVCAALFSLGYLYVFLLDQATYNNHNYLIWLLSLLLVFVPAHRSGSLDARRRPALRSPTLPAWTLDLLRFQLGVPYFLGGVAKLNHDWLVRAQPMTLWLEEGRAAMPPGPLDARQAGYLLSWGGALFDLAIVPLLLYRRTRVFAYAAAVAFHLANSQLFNIGIFPWLMIAATAMYFPPGWPRRLGFFGRRPPPDAAPTPPRRRRLTEALLAGWVAVQLLVPFRHFLYPGNVDWTEEGHRFAWRMKIRDKSGEVRLMAVDPASRQATVLRGLRDVVTDRQYQKMLHQPDMIRQLAHFLAGRLRERGMTEVEIRAITSISLNGRPPAPIIDPEVDLAATERGLLPADWILPLDSEARE